MSQTLPTEPTGPWSASAITPSRQGGFWPHVVVLLVAGAELTGAVLTTLRPELLALVLLFHVGLAIVLLVLGFERLRHPCVRRELLFTILAIAALGPLGVCGATLVLIQTRIMSGRATPFATWHAGLFPRLAADPVEELYARVALQRAESSDDASLAPFGDVMAGGTEGHKQAVISLIAENFNASFAPTLLQALNDPDPAIRVQAATAAARLEGAFLSQAMRLENLRAQAPNDPAAALVLARHYDAYAYSGLLEPSRARSALQQALDLYRFAYTRGTRGMAESKAVGRVLLKLGRPDEALHTLELEARQPEAAPETVVWYLEALFRLRRWEELRAAARCLEGAALGCPGLRSEVREALLFWARQPCAEEARA